MNSDNAQSLFTASGVEGHVIRISSWYEVDGPTSYTHDHNIPVLAVVVFLGVNVPHT